MSLKRKIPLLAGAALAGDIPQYFVDATGGLDSNSGLSPDKAWQTVTKVNTSTFAPGTWINFKAGETWQATPAVKNGAAIRCSSSGAPGSPIVYSRYGAGADPVFDNCVIYTDWVLYDSPTYRRAESSDGDYGNHVFENGVRLIKTTSIANVKTIAGSWFGSGGYVYVHTTTGASPNGLNVGYPAEGGYSMGFDVNGKSWITARYLHVTRPKNHSFATNVINGTVGFVADHCTASWSGRRGFRIAPVTFDGAHQLTDCQIKNCVSHDTGAECFWIGGCIGTIFENCEAYNGKVDYVTKNIGTAVDVGGVVIGIWANGVIMRNNYIHNSYHNCLLLLEQEAGFGASRPTGCIIEKNHFLHNVNMTTSVQVGLEGDSTCIFRNNIVECTVSPANNSNSINVGNGAVGMQVYHNTVINRISGSSAWPISIGGASSAVVKDNIFRNTVADYAITVSADSSVTLSNNQYSGDVAATHFYAMHGATEYSTAQFPNWCSDMSETNSHLSNPLFVSEATPDYHLQSGSPCRGAGVNVGVTDDYDGVPRPDPPDVGAFQYVA